MSTDISTDVAAHKAPLMSGGSIRPIVPQDFDGAWRIAKAVVQAGMAPRGLDTPEKATIAIMHGMEVGMPPMAALQSIAVVNGRPTIWGDGALALVRASGLLAAFDEWSEGTGDAYTAFCRVRRKGEQRDVVSKFSVAQAKASGLWTKRGQNGQPTPWQTYPERMLQMRARAYALRDTFADVLRGLGIAEEVRDTETIGSEATRTVERPRSGEIERPPIAPPGDDAGAKPHAIVDIERAAENPVERPPTAQESLMVEVPAVPDPWADGDMRDQPEDFETQADQICDALEAAQSRDELERVADQWAERVAAMPKEIRSRCAGRLKACRAKFAGA